MGQPIDRTPYTLAQLARRAGISEGRARGLYAAGSKPGAAVGAGLPRPDHTDADGRPLWWAATIDAWCARTGREIDEDALWVFTAPAADRPVAELRRGVVTLDGPDGRASGPRKFYVIVWDTEAGHLVYLQPLGPGDGNKDWLAVYGTQLLEPRWWGSAVIVMPMEENLAFFPEHRDDPIGYVYRLRTRQTVGPDGDGGGAGRGGGVRRWLGLGDRRGDRRGDGLGDNGSGVVPRAEWVTHLDLADIARVVGRPIPIWIDGTDTEANAERALSFGDRTFTAVDEVTDWPDVQTMLGLAVESGLAREFPAGFAAMAVDAVEELDRIRTAQDNTREAGDGWFLVCRPARPAPPVEMEQQLRGARRVTDDDLVAAELRELRTIEGDLDIDDSRGEVHAAAIEALAAQLRETTTVARKNAGGASRGVEGHDYVPIADEPPQRFSALWAGPVVSAWRKTLTPVDVAAALRLRRVRRVLQDDDLDQIQEAYRDPAGRYVLVLPRAGDQDWFVAEWPTDLGAVGSWTEKTTLAGDGRGTVTALLALTSTDDGGLRIDPVPLPPRASRDGFAYGYGGGTPATTYAAILRCALGDTSAVGTANGHSLDRGPDGTLLSQLRQTIHTTTGPLRLPWDTVQRWATADADHGAELDAQSRTQATTTKGPSV